MTEGRILLAPVPQADGAVKPRPVLALRHIPPFGYLLVCGISSQLRHEIKDFDEIIRLDASNFPTSGLQTESLIRLGFLGLLPQKRILADLGRISKERHGRLLRNLAEHLVANAATT